jgi:hypothetical protein
VVKEQSILEIDGHNLNNGVYVQMLLLDGEPTSDILLQIDANGFVSLG